MSLNEIISEARLLKPQDRYKIIENLVSSLNESNSKIENIWIDESQKRIQAIKDNRLETVSYQEVFGS